MTADWKSSAGTLDDGVEPHLHERHADDGLHSVVRRSVGYLLSDLQPRNAACGGEDRRQLLLLTSADNAEVRFASARIDRFEFLAGGFLHVPGSAITHWFSRLRTPTAHRCPRQSTISRRKASAIPFQEEAVFGNATYYITDSLDITGGVRYTKDKQGGLITVDGLLSAPPVQLSSDDNKTLYQGTCAVAPLARSHRLCPYCDGLSSGWTGEQPGGADSQLRTRHGD